MSDPCDRCNDLPSSLWATLCDRCRDTLDDLNRRYPKVKVTTVPKPDPTLRYCGECDLHRDEKVFYNQEGEEFPWCIYCRRKHVGAKPKFGMDYKYTGHDSTVA